MALYKIARLFSILYSNPNTRGSGLEVLDQRLLESIDYAICQNSLRSRENGLWLHVFKSPENAYVKKIFG
nr:hypothetical protein [Tanacetum cinerariifolium]